MTVRDERFEALLGTAAALVAAVFDALPDAIGVVWPIVDETGALVDFEVGYTNPSSERMMGVRLGDEAGARLREVMPGVLPMGCTTASFGSPNRARLSRRRSRWTPCGAT